MKEIAPRNSKRKADETPFAGKKLRSTRSRRKSAQISPFVVQSPLWSKEIGVSAASVDSCSDLLFAVDDNVSCGSSRVEKSSNRIEEVEVSGPVKYVKETTIADPKLRRITRSYSKLNKEKEEVEEIEVSESSFTRSDVTFVEHISDSRNLNFESEYKENDVVSVISGVESCSKFGSVTGGADNEETEISKPSSFVAAEISLGSAKVPKPGLEIVDCVSDLACSEKFSDEEVSDYPEDDLSEPRSEIYSQYSDLDFSDYTPSIFIDSGSEFSEKSCPDSPISHTHSLFLELKEQFCRSTIPNDLESACQEGNREFQSEVSV